MAKGGFFAGQPYQSPADDEDTVRRAAVLWGKIVVKPRVSQPGKKVKVEFTVKWGVGHAKGRTPTTNSGYRHCEAWGESNITAVMAAVERGETVVCFGEWKVSYSQEKRKQLHVFACQAVIPMSFMEFLLKLYNSPNIQRLLVADENEPSDPVFEDDIGF